MNWYGLIFVVAGTFAVLAAALDWDFFMNHRKARFFVRFLGRGGTRIFYALLGIVLATYGLIVTLGRLQGGGA